MNKDPDHTRVIFLDIDGVLNCHSDFMKKRRGHKYEVLNKNMISRFKQLVKDINPTIVLSSTWRLHDNLKEYLKKKKIVYHDVTPDYGYSERFGKRGAEIDEWLLKHIEVENFVIVDDVNDFYNQQQEFVVITDFYGKDDTDSGLQDKHIEKIKEILR